eukprot:1159385-Pelagomonas_calceolata.AAC.2
MPALLRHERDKVSHLAIKILPNKLAERKTHLAKGGKVQLPHAMHVKQLKGSLHVLLGCPVCKLVCVAQQGQASAQAPPWSSD